MKRFEMPRASVSSLLSARRAMSAVGTFSIARTSPASSAATRVGSFAMMRSVARSQAGFGPQ